MDFEPILDSLSARVPHSDSEYIGDDGLTHCSVCHKKTQTIISFMGREKTVRCVCECKKNEMEADRKRREADNRRDICFGVAEMRKWTFENDDRANAKLSDAMMRYTEQFDDFLKIGKGLILYGTVGTGKSYYAACIANRLIDKGYRVKMTNFASLTNQIQDSLKGKQQIIDDLSVYQLLIIDDLGAERKSEYMQEMVFNIIDSRYRSGLPFIVTTNLTGDELKKPQDVSFARIYDRILERCFPIEITGKSRRRKELIETHADIKSALGL